MKRFVLLAFISVVAIAAYGQTGLLGISFGDDYAHAALLLMDADPPFELEFKKSRTAVFENASSAEIYAVQLWLKHNRVVGWSISFYDIEGGIDILLARLVEIHGSDYEWIDDQYLWRLSPDARVSLWEQYGEFNVEYYIDSEK